MSVSLSKKLFLFIFTLFVLTILPLFYIAETALWKFGDYAYIVNEEQINQMAQAYMKDAARRIAQAHNEIFKRIKTGANVMGLHMGQIYRNIDALSLSKAGEYPLIWNPGNHMFQGPVDDPVSVCYWGGETIGDDVQKEINALTHYMGTLIGTKALLTECQATHVITTSGLGYYCSHDSAARAKVFQLPPPAQFDLRDGAPMTVFTRSDTRETGTRWTALYKDDVTPGLMMTATTPVYGDGGTLKAVTGIDFPVDHVVESMTDTSFLEGLTNEDNSFVFLQKEDGNLIAFPKAFQEVFGLDFNIANMVNSDDICTVGLAQSALGEIRDIAPQTLSVHNGIIDLTIGDEDYLLAVGCLKEVEWHVVLVTKKADIMASLDKTTQALAESHRIVWFDFIGHSLVILLLACGVSFYAVKKFIAPLNDFIRTTQKIAGGDLSETLEVGGQDEIGLLSRSLNRMVEQLKTSEGLQNDYAEKLKAEVSSRTRALEEANRQLGLIKNELEQKVDQKTRQLKKLNLNLLETGETERKAIASDLHDSVAQTLALSIGKLKNLKDEALPEQQEQILEIESRMGQAIGEIRMMIYQLRPPVLDDFEIDIALEQLIKGYQKDGKCRIRFSNKTDTRVETSQPVRLVVYRVTNELIVNVLKHARAESALVELTNDGEELCVKVEDDGIGFDWNIVQKTKLSAVGLISVSERIKNAGGAFGVFSRPGQGSKIIFSLPFRPERMS
ncbi:MAG TPA: hypothetical protein DHV36_00565 [Desulfobacteraceae bacterium]|nr:hypothetical protein [Desulfobacteraceae bacterium]